MKDKNGYTLTKSEMQVMKALWSAGKALDVHEVVAQYDEPQPAYTTISTFLKILSTKGFVDFKKGNGKQYLYFPLISQAQYTSRVMKEVKNSFFGGSVKSMLSYFVQEENLSEDEIKELLDLIHNS
ncbi:MAG: BlaI/MecI/CopY family transcriptional regulator [Bacteroidaceae bacterium]|nr:BlaI/MecI/CopY family transcriptional regulator [Bacteroidaceae bacterium]